ncbi:MULTISPECIES: CPBP family intramembrane glutamic endopeptidase [Listeria]|uniref:CPBP family intramembrane glutamic endopeptidase n=1 Tax=Listeria TaxID=1637 RepID=UPI000B58B42B|nr:MULTISPECIES: type II CAAX endopeptidase family protein [Listeria]
MPIENDEKQPKAWLGIIWVVLYFILDSIGQFIAILLQFYAGTMDTALNHFQMTWYMNLTQAFALGVIILLAYSTNMRLFSFKPFSKKATIQALIIGAATLLVSNVLEFTISLLNPNFNTANQTGLEGFLTNSSVLTMFTAIVILAPIAEETIFRGLIMGVILRKYPKIAVIVSSLLFTFLHIPTDILSFLIYFVMAFGLAFMYYKTRRLEACILLHFINNLVAFFFMI